MMPIDRQPHRLVMAPPLISKGFVSLRVRVARSIRFTKGGCRWRPMARLHPSHRHLRREQAIRDAVDTSASDITARTRKPPLSPLEYIDLAARQELLFKDEV